jgi:hypothetical protein
MQEDISTGSAESDCRAADVVDVLLVLAPDPELDTEAVERLMRGLRAEIVELDVESVRPGPSAAAPGGAKGSDPLTLGAVVVALSASGGVFSVLVETVRDWLSRHSARHRVSLTIDGDTIELERASDAERRDLVDAYIRRHTGG